MAWIIRPAFNRNGLKARNFLRAFFLSVARITALSFFAFFFAKIAFPLF